MNQVSSVSSFFFYGNEHAFDILTSKIMTISSFKLPWITRDPRCFVFIPFEGDIGENLTRQSCVNYDPSSSETITVLSGKRNTSAEMPSGHSI